MFDEKTFQGVGPLLSVVIPFHLDVGGLRGLMRTLRAASAKQDLEVVLVADRHLSQQDVTQLENMLVDDWRWSVCTTFGNSGPGYARNCGIAAASGHFICFVDSDDALRPDVFTNLCFEMMEVDACVGKCGYHVLHLDGRVSSFLPKDDQRPIAVHIKEHAAPWSFVFERRRLQEWGIAFPTWTTSGEDLVFLLQLNDFCEVVATLHDVGYEHYVGSSLQTTAQEINDGERLELLAWLANTARVSLKKETRMIASMWFVRSSGLWVVRSNSVFSNLSRSVHTWRQNGNGLWALFVAVIRTGLGYALRNRGHATRRAGVKRRRN